MKWLQWETVLRLIKFKLFKYLSSLSQHGQRMSSETLTELSAGPPYSTAAQVHLVPKRKPLLQGPLLVQAKKGKPSGPTAHNLVWEGRQMEFTLI